VKGTDEMKALLQKKFHVFALFLCILLTLSGCTSDTSSPKETMSSVSSSKAPHKSPAATRHTASKSSKKIKSKKVSTAIKNSKIKKIKIPSFKGKAYVVLNHNKPRFKKSELTTKVFERYHALDSSVVVAPPMPMFVHAPCQVKHAFLSAVSNLLDGKMLNITV